MPIQIQFLANVVNFLRGTKNVEEALDDVADSLDDVAKDAQHSGDDIGDSLQDAAKDGEKAGDRLQRTFRELASSARTSGDDIGDSLGSGVKHGTDKAEEGLDEFKRESNSTARESAASFTGEWTDVGDIVQEIAANAFAGFGALGAGAGLLVAAGIGVAISAIQNGIEGAEEYRQKVADLGQEFIDTGKLGEASLEFVIKNLQDMATTTEDGQASLSKLNKLSRDSGTSFKDLAQAYGNNVDALKQQWRETDKLAQSQYDAAEAASMVTDGSKGNYGALLAQAEATQKVTDYIGQQIGVATAGAESQRLYAQAGGPELEAKAALLGQVNDAYDEAAGDIDAYLNAESGIFETQAYIDSMNARSDALATYQSNLASSGLTPEAKAFLNSQGAEAAASFLAGYVAATPEQKTALGRIWTEAGKTNSGEYQTALKGSLPDKLDKKVKVEADADTSKANSDLNAFANKTRTTKVIATVVDKYGRAVG